MDKKTKIFAIVSTLVFVVVYFGSKHLREVKHKKEIIGTWESKELEGENFSFIFDAESALINNGRDTIRMKYTLNENVIQLSKDGIVKSIYDYKIENDKLILSEKGDNLKLYKR